MRYTRRRYDLLLAICTPLLLTGGIAADLLIRQRVTPRALALLIPAALLLLLRFRIPREGWEDQSLGERPPVERRFLGWCLFWLLAHLCAIPLAWRTRDYWWAWILWDVVFFAATLTLARRVDRARAASRLRGDSSP